MKLLFSLFPFLLSFPLKACPPDFTSLTSALSQTLQPYLNRSYSKYGIKTHAQVVSFPDLNPLPIGEPDPTVRQLFLTITHRRSGQLTLDRQTYWLFIVETPQKWKLAMAFTRIGDAPPIDVSEGAVADAVRQWLRDRCS